ncbi:TetR/AcrR family transcriptional regulator [Leucothrix pacifica]|uniref:TetR family transcriptional regulator n=1 Tax=Leucothrix pacifica TaxID=1247513 RepID=A0A317CD82_9GAMM|nr:TetR/AcrR family transcriptional regulator [Leucothrix pacifica]PWQ96496.1 TetR family transcriptional regulator [Leucothrix pacifica]
MPYLKRQVPDPEPIDCKILTSALELFIKNGFHSVSIHQIQKHADVSIGSIYNHFGGKEGIAKQLYMHISREFEELVDDGISAGNTATEQCTEIIRLMFGYTETHSDIMAYIFNIRHAEFLSDQPLLCESAGFEKIRGVVQQGIEQGEFVAMEPVVAASCIFGGPIRLMQLRLDGMVATPLDERLFQQVTASAFCGITLPMNQSTSESQVVPISSVAV